MTQNLTATEAAQVYHISGSWLICNCILKGGKIQARMVGLLYVLERAGIEEWRHYSKQPRQTVR